MKKLLFNYFLYFSCLVFVCLIGISKVFAFEYTYTVVSDIYSYTEQLVSTTYGSAPYNNPRNSGYAFGDVFQVDYIVSNYTFNANTNYQLESHLPNQVFTNVNAYKVSGLNGEACMTSYANSILNNDHYPRWAFQCPHQTNTITITIYNSTNQNLWSGTDIFNWSSAVLWSSSTPMTSSDTNSIINNQNQNTQDIINNQNQNTQDIQDTINDNFNTTINCDNLFRFNLIENGNRYIGLLATKKNNGVYNFSGTSTGIYLNLSDISYFNDTYIISSNTKIKINNYYVNNNSSIDVIYDNNNNKTYLRLVNGQNYDFDIDFTISNNNYLDNYCEYGTSKTINKLDEQKDAINNLDDTLKDDDVNDATNQASDFFSDFDTNTFGLTSIITAPLNLIQSLTSSTCSQLELPLPYLDNKKLILPCMTTIYSTYFGTFFTMYQTITYGIIAYWVCVRIFNMVKDFKNPEHDEIEVVDL